MNEHDFNNLTDEQKLKFIHDFKTKMIEFNTDSRGVMKRKIKAHFKITLYLSNLLFQLNEIKDVVEEHFPNATAKRFESIISRCVKKVRENENRN